MFVFLFFASACGVAINMRYYFLERLAVMCVTAVVELTVQMCCVVGRALRS